MKHIIINIGRQLGSGGHDIGRMLALDFQAKYYDRELLNLAAKESGLSEKIFEQNDEKKGFFRGLLNLGSPHVSSGRVYNSGVSQESLFQFQSEAIKKAANEGSCVFVGRCADYVLRNLPNTVSVFVTASMDYRVQQIMNKRHLDEALSKGRANVLHTIITIRVRSGEPQRAMTCASIRRSLVWSKRRRLLPSL